MSSLESTFKPTGKKVDYENYWEAPAYLWEQKEVTEREMECVMVRFFFVFAFAFSILPPIHLCTSWFSSSLYLYCVLVLCYGCFPHLSSSSFPLQVLPSLFVSFKQNKKKKLTSSRSYLNSLAVQQILGRDLKMCIAKSRNSNVQTIEEEQDAYSYGLP